MLVPLCRAANLSGLQGPHGAAHCRWSKDHLKSQIRRPFNALSLCVRRQICSWLDVRACRARAPRALPCYQAAESRRAPRRRCPTTSTATTTRWTRTCLARSRRCALTRACRGAGSTATSTSTWRARPRASSAQSLAREPACEPYSIFLRAQWATFPLLQLVFQIGDAAALLAGRTHGASLYGATAGDRALAAAGKAAHAALLVGAPLLQRGPGAAAAGVAAYMATQAR